MSTPSPHHDFNKHAGVTYQSDPCAKPKAKACLGDAAKPFSIRLSARERELLNQMAGRKPLGAFVRAKLFGTAAEKRTRHQYRPSVDYKLFAQALSLLGNSRIASNLNQLAKAANIGALPVDDDVIMDLRQACIAVDVMRHELLAAMGQTETDASDKADPDHITYNPDL